MNGVGPWFREVASEGVAQALSDSQRTIQSYEGFARQYSGLISPRPPRSVAAAIRRLMQLLPPEGSVLEVGSGSGRDADFIESLGASVRRTDATQAFLDLQAERGKYGERLNLLTDDLGGPYDGVLAMCVLIHMDRDHTDGVLSKVREALRPDGAFLVSVRDGAGETTGNYHMTYCSRAAFAARLAEAGFKVEWDRRSVDSDRDTWLTFLARRSQ